MCKKIENSLVMIINSKNEKGDIDGNIDFVGKIFYDKNIHNIQEIDDINDIDRYKTHIDYLLEYGQEKYPDVQIFNLLSTNHFYQVIVYFLSIFNNIVYLNISVSKYQQKGLLFMPDEISEKQKNSLFKIAQESPNANVQILYDLNLNDGNIDLQEFDAMRGSSFEDVLSDYFVLMDRKKDIEKKSKN